MSMTYRSAGTALTNAQIDSNLRTVESRYNGIPMASATNIAPVNEYNYMVISGGTNIATITDVSVGFRLTLTFSATGGDLVHSANLILPNSANYTWEDNDGVVLVNEAVGVWRLVRFQRYSTPPEEYPTESQADNSVSVATTAYTNILLNTQEGWRLAGTLDTSSGTAGALTFDTDPTGIKLVFNEVAVSSSIGRVYVQLAEDALYTSQLTVGGAQSYNSSSYTAGSTSLGIPVIAANGSYQTGWSGIVSLSGNNAINTWGFQGVLGNENNSNGDHMLIAGMSDENGGVDRIRVHTNSAFTKGSVDIWYRK